MSVDENKWKSWVIILYIFSLLKFIKYPKINLLPSMLRNIATRLTARYTQPFMFSSIKD